MAPDLAGDGDHYFKTADAATCFGPGDLQDQALGAAGFTGHPDLELEHTVYVVP